MINVQAIIAVCRKSANYKGLQLPEIYVNNDEFIRRYAESGGGALCLNPKSFKMIPLQLMLEEPLNPWVSERTLLVAPEFPTETLDMHRFAIVVHETGHAILMANKIPNSEAHAYIFEIQIIIENCGNPIPGLEFNYSDAEADTYLQSRMGQFRISLGKGNEAGSGKLRSVLEGLSELRFPKTVAAFKDYLEFSRRAAGNIAAREENLGGQAKQTAPQTGFFNMKVPLRESQEINIKNEDTSLGPKGK